MIKSTITISNKLGLHARASAKLTKLAGSFQSDVFMAVMMLAAGLGTEVELETVGVDEQLAMDALRKLIDDKFGEAE